MIFPSVPVYHIVFFAGLLGMSSQNIIVLRVLFLAGLLPAMLVTIALASDVPQKQGIIRPGISREPPSIVAGEPLFLPLNPPRSPLFNECAFCESGRSEWHYDVRMLKHMAYECGFDYLLMRFDRTYRFDSITVAATYYFSATTQSLRFDSSVVRYGTIAARKTLFFPCNSCNTMPTLPASAAMDTSFFSKLQLIDKAEAFSKSFSSAMLAASREGGLRIAFSFGIAGTSFVLDERTGVTTLALPVNVHGIDTGCAAYKLAFYLAPSRVAAVDNGRGNGPAIHDVTLSYTETQQVSITFTAASDIGLREAQFSSDAYEESVYFNGTRREGITKTLQLDSSHYRLAITLFDIRGNSASVSYPVFEARREAGRLVQARRKQIEQERVWAEKSPVNEALYTLGQLDGNIGMWFKAISDALVSEDVQTNSARDAAMRDAAMKKALKKKTMPSSQAKPDTERTGVEVIGE